MAEFVAQSLTQIKAELENVPFLNLEEKRKILKKRERYEYRIRKRTKAETDFLLYIQYEKDVLKFFKMRKRDRGMKSRAEVPVIKRIHQLYELCQTRFPQSADVFLAHIEFCKKEKEFGRVSRLFHHMLRFHSTETDLWVKAAEWEVEQSNVDEARVLMQRCTNANRSSILAWTEFYRLELEIAKSLRGKGEEINDDDPTQNGAIAELVAKHSLQRCPDNIDLLMSLIEVAGRFKFAASHRKELVQKLKEDFSDVPQSWDFLARRHLPTKKKQMSRLLEAREDYFFNVFEEAVKEIPTSEMWSLYLTAALELLSAPMPDSDRMLKRVGRVNALFQRASDQDCLSLDMFPQWLELLRQQGGGEEEDGVEGRVQEVCGLMTRRFPHGAEAWEQCVRHLCAGLSPPHLVLECVSNAAKSLPERDQWRVYEPALHYLSSANQELESIMEKPCSSVVSELSMPARLFHLRWTSIHKDMAAVRELFNKWYAHSNSLEYYLLYVQQELMEEKVKMSNVRRAFDRAVMDHGSSSPDLWLQYIHVESRFGDPLKASGLGNSALIHLPKGPLQDAFVLRRSEGSSQ